MTYAFLQSVFVTKAILCVTQFYTNLLCDLGNFTQTGCVRYVILQSCCVTLAILRKPAVWVTQCWQEPLIHFDLPRSIQMPKSQPWNFEVGNIIVCFDQKLNQKMTKTDELSLRIDYWWLLVPLLYFYHFFK